MEMLVDAALSSFFQGLFEQLNVFLRSDYFYNFWDSGNQLKELDKKLLRIQVILKDAEARIQDYCVNNWMDDLRDLAYDVDNILDEMNTERMKLEQEATKQVGNDAIGNFLTCLGNLKGSADNANFTAMIKGKIGEVLLRLDEVTKEADALRLKGTSGTSSMLYQFRLRPETGPLVDEYEVYGRKEDKEALIKLLLESSDSNNKSYYVIPIVGMRGIGKTTLAQVIFQDKRVENYFELQSWAFVSEVFDIAKVTRDLIQCVTKDNYSNMSFASLQLHFRDMVRNKKCFLVLDDVWTVKEWESLEALFYCCASGSKIIVTTRNRKIANAISNKEPYKLGILEDEHCLALFKRKAFRGVNTYINCKLTKIGMEIVKKCKGVPLIVNALGAILEGAAVEKWENILRNELWKSIGGDDGGIFLSLKKSYDYLPSSLKRCFEYLCLFPSDYVFQKGKLIRLWMAEGFVEDNAGRLAEDIGIEYYDELQQRFLIQEDNMVHELVHSLACLVSRKFYCRLPSDAKTCNFIGTIRHSSFHATHIEEAEFDMLLEAKKLCSILFLPSNSRALRGSVLNWSLRVLDVRWVEEFELPHFIGKLKHLRYLDLSSNHHLQNLPDAIFELYNLQALNLFDCFELDILPKAIENLRNLWYLNLSSTSVSSLPSSICKLSHLVTLHLYSCKNLANNPENTGDLGSTSSAGVPVSICKLHYLQSLNLGYCGKVRCLPNDIGDLQSLRELYLEHTSILSLPHSICQLHNLQVLHLKYCKSLSQLPEDMGNLQELRVLLLSFTPISSLPDSICKLHNLQVLDLCFCKSLAHLPGNIGDLRELREFLLRLTPISALPDSICKLQNLQLLDLVFCEGLSQLPKDWGVLQSLKKLQILL